MSTEGASTSRGVGPHRLGRLQPGEVLDGKYRIVRLIAQGGSGSVFEGEHQLIARKVAIKVLHAQFADDDVAVRRFEREARATAQIGSENIVDVLDLGELPGGERYLVMEYLEGQSLRDRMQGPVRPAEIVPIVLQLLSALGAAHEAGIIHRDVKPENIFLVRRKPTDPVAVKVLDFGVSKSQSRAGFDGELTSVGAIIGTPFYMSPEQAFAKPVDARTDLYAVGVILFQALAGQLPYNVASFTQLVVQFSMEAAPKLGDVAPGVDAELAAIVDKAMARSPDARYSTAEGLSQALSNWLMRQSSWSGVGMAAASSASDPAAATQGGPGGPGPTRAGSSVPRTTIRGIGGPLSPPAPPVVGGYRGSPMASAPPARPSSGGYPTPSAGAGTVRGEPGSPLGRGGGGSAGPVYGAATPDGFIPGSISSARPAAAGPLPNDFAPAAPAVRTGQWPRSPEGGAAFGPDPTMVGLNVARRGRLRTALAVVLALIGLGVIAAAALLLIAPAGVPGDSPSTSTANNGNPDGHDGEPNADSSPRDAAADAAGGDGQSTDSTEPAADAAATASATASAEPSDTPAPKTLPPSGRSSRPSGGKGKPKPGSTGSRPGPAPTTTSAGDRTIQTEL